LSGIQLRVNNVDTVHELCKNPTFSVQGGFRVEPVKRTAKPGSRPCGLLSINLKLRNIVASKLILDCSPKQISGWLKTQYPDDESMRVSHETIYRSLFIQARGALKKELLEHLRSKRRIRRSQHSRIFKDGRGQIPEAISIRGRPATYAATSSTISCDFGIIGTIELSKANASPTRAASSNRSRNSS
jgi:IS30 family transposase